MSKRKFYIKRVVAQKTYNANGELIRTIYQYVICYKRFRIFTCSLRFYKLVRGLKLDIVLLKEVEISYTSNFMMLRASTHFDSEKDAKKVLQDMIEHPNKYVYNR